MARAETILVNPHDETVDMYFRLDETEGIPLPKVIGGQPVDWQIMEEIQTTLGPRIWAHGNRQPWYKDVTPMEPEE